MYVRFIHGLFILLAVAMLGGCFGSNDTDATVAIGRPIEGTGNDSAQESSPAASQPGSTKSTVAAGSIEVSIGMAASQVTKIMGAAEAISADSAGREVWTYENCGANFVYSAQNNGVRTMIIDGYSKDSGIPLLVRITFDSSRKVVDFHYQQMAF